MKRVFIILLLFLFLTTLATAKISIDSEVKDTYNLGDTIELAITTSLSTNYGNLNINLVCGNKTTNLMKWAAVSFGEQTNYALPKKILTKQDLEIEDINDILGQCQISATLGDEQDLTKIFTITREIKINANFEKANYNPGESIVLNLETIKSNGYPLNGFLEIFGATNIAKTIEKGKLTESFKMPETTEAGHYSLEIFVYDRGEDNEILNQANATITFNINQVPSFIQTSLSTLELEPGKELQIGLDLFDQSGIAMPGVISSIIVSPNKKETYLSTNSEEISSISFPTNATPGTYTIISSYNDIKDSKTFIMQSIQKIEIEFLDTILIIKNVGNDIYNKTIKINIGNEIRELELNIKVGEERRFNLKAPNGEYEVSVTDGTDTSEKTLLLTGGAIAINDLKGLAIFTKYPIIWIFIIIILGLIGIVIFFKYRKSAGTKLKDKLGKISPSISSTMHFTNKSPESQSLDERNVKDSEKDMLNLSEPKTMEEAESSLVLKGQKQKSSIVVLKISNKLGKNSKEELGKILQVVKTKRGVIDFKGEYLMIIFTPRVTKTFNNENLAAKVGFEIFKGLQKHNKKFSEKIDFSIGINSGDLITSIENKKLKYTSIGNTILVSKKIADQGRNQLLVSSGVRNKLGRGLRTQKAGAIGSTPVYSISNVLDSEANQAKLQDILKRMERD